MEPEAKLLQRKIIGVLIRAARERARRTIKEAALRMGVTPARVRQWERGAREVTLPDLETLARFFHAPPSFFLEGDSMALEVIAPPPTEAEVHDRRAAIGARLKQARVAMGKSREECATEIARKPGTISRYERGASDIPLGELDRLAHFLNVNLYYFIERGGDAHDAGDLMDMDKFARLPQDVRAFALDPANLPFLRMAQKFGDLPVEKLKELGEILLVVK
ncbi:MAG: helix-turn-helix transcriptional regulator [Chloroflexi bacterium]|nr:helix-turn-helix transcriptional regulator [Chloroflexota bacterium]